MPSITANADTMGCSHGYFDAIDVGGNDSAYGQCYEIVSQGSIGSAYIDNFGILTYQSSYNIGTDYVTYRVWDDWDSVGATAQVTIIVTNANPTGVADSFSTDHETPLYLSSEDLTTNDLDYDPVDQWGGLFVQSVGNAVNGIVSLLNGTITFTPDLDFTGEASFTYIVRDSLNAVGSAVTAVVNVGASDWKCGNKNGTGRPGPTINNPNNAINTSWYGKGPKNAKGCIHYTLVKPDGNGGTLETTGTIFFDTNGSGAWYANLSATPVLVGSTLTYELFYKSGILNGHPTYTAVPNTKYTTEVE